MLRVPQKSSRQDTRKVALCLQMNLKDHPGKMYRNANLEKPLRKEIQKVPRETRGYLPDLEQTQQSYISAN